MSEASKNLLIRFREKQSEKDSSSLLDARRLVNLYRSLPCFGDGFLDQYNQMLLSVKPNVRRLLRNFMGGEEVEDYLQFLEQNVHLSDTQEEQKTTNEALQKTGYLPDPDEDTTNAPSDGMIKISESEWKQVNAQRESLLEQTQNLLKALGKLEHDSSVSKKMAPSFKNNPSTSSFENYSEIIEESGEKRP